MQTGTRRGSRMGYELDDLPIIDIELLLDRPVLGQESFQLAHCCAPTLSNGTDQKQSKANTEIFILQPKLKTAARNGVIGCGPTDGRIVRGIFGSAGWFRGWLRWWAWLLSDC